MSIYETRAATAAQAPQEGGREMRPLDDFYEYVRDYAREKPETAAIVCFAIGFILGWKLKPW